MTEEFVRIVRKHELEGDFLDVPSKGIDILPEEKGKIKVELSGSINELTYNPKYRRIYGLSPWFKNNFEENEEIEIKFQKSKNNIYKIQKIDFKKKKIEETQANLSSQAKGIIIEDRIKELIMLHQKGFLNVYSPDIDVEGIDLIVVKNGFFHPIFIQVKGSFKLNDRKQVRLSIKAKGFVSHHNFWIVGAHYNLEKGDLEENILFIPSEALDKVKTVAKKRPIYRIETKLDSNKESKGWARYLIKKEELANKLIDKFEEINNKEEKINK